MDKDNLNYLEVMREYVSAARMPLPQRLDRVRLVEADIETLPREYILGRIMLLYLGRAFIEDARIVARLRAARTAMAIERYRLRYNRLPEELNEIVPDFLDAVPADPFNGRPLRYVRLPTGYMVYSLGEDGVDNGGERNRGPKGNQNDYGFRVER